MTWNPSKHEAPSREIQWLSTERQFSSVLDVGCGWGRNLVPFVGVSAAVHGFDLDEDAVRQATTRFGRSSAVKVWLDDVRTARLTQAYELVICLGVLHFLSREERMSCYRTIGQWVNLDGYVVVVMFNSKVPIPEDLAPLMFDVPADSHELLTAFADWETISHESYIYDDEHDGGRIRHTHSIDRLIVRRTA